VTVVPVHPAVYTLGLDLGGTSLKGGVVDAQGRVHCRCATASELHSHPERLLASLDDLITRLRAEAAGCNWTVAGIGLSSTIDVDPMKGRFKFASYGHLKQWADFPIRDHLQATYGLPALVENDGIAAAWGEYRAGAGRGCASMLQVMLGTGIGGGAVLDGQRLPGSVGSGACFGHMSIDLNGPRCVCGQRGCWELYASGAALEARAAQAVADQGTTRLGPKPDGRTIATAAAEGDSLALALLAETGRYLGHGLVNLANLFNPEVIVLGGGLVKAGAPLLRPAQQILAERRLPLRPVLEVRTAQLGADSGVAGAALLMHETLQRVHG
jgi:glucokinase